MARRGFIGLAGAGALTLLTCSLHAATVWRPATPAELAQLIPARAPVIAERIETELRSASGVTDGRGHFLAGVVLITAGYSANGKYADYLILQTPIRVRNADDQEIPLPPGGYLIGWTRDNDSLLVTISEAATGKALLQTQARRNDAIHRVEQLRVWPPPHGLIQLGRFTVEYTVPEKNGEKAEKQ